LRRCGLPGCDKPHKAKGYCERHYKQWKKGRLEIVVSLESAQKRELKAVRRFGAAKSDGRERVAVPGASRSSRRADETAAKTCCRVNGCGSPARRNGYCIAHYRRLMLIRTKNARDGLRAQLESYYEEEAEATDEVAYPEDLDEMESDSSIFLYDYLDKGLPSDADYE